jgi:uncharacterized protein YeaO (DUF488 family)
MGKILVKRVYEPPAKSDGFRVLVDPLWRRGPSKSDVKLDLWLPDLGPSTALRNGSTMIRHGGQSSAAGIMPS